MAYTQIQFGVVRVSEHLKDINVATRNELEGPLNNGWKLNNWEVVERGVDSSGNPMIFIAVCLIRELDTEPIEPEEDD